MPSITQSEGEKGDRITPLLGESVVGEKTTGDWGIRRRRSVVGVREDGVRESEGLINGEGGTRGADVADIFLSAQLQAQLLPALEGVEIGVSLPDLSEKLNVVLLPVPGLDMAGDKALRKSV